LIASASAGPLQQTKSNVAGKPAILTSPDVKTFSAAQTKLSSMQKMELTNVMSQPMDLEVEINARPLGPVGDYDYAARHPAIGDSAIGGGTYLWLAYSDLNRIDDQYRCAWTGSNDSGQTWWDSYIYWDMGNDPNERLFYPSLDYWGLDSGMHWFYGVFVPPVEFHNGGVTFITSCNDTTDQNGYSGSYWDWSTYGWHDSKMVEMAADDAQETWNWGIAAHVMSTTYTAPDPPDYINGPFINYQTSEDGYGTISWYSDLEGCTSCSIDIDPIIHVYPDTGNFTQPSIAAYDWEEPENETNQLFLRMDNFDDMSGDEVYEDWNNALWYMTDTALSINYPCVQMYDNNLVILTELENTTTGDIDIISWWTHDGNVSNLDVSLVAYGDDQERFPDLSHVDGAEFDCVYTKHGGTYDVLCSRTTFDGGETWTIERPVGYEKRVRQPSCNIEQEDVVWEYRNADIVSHGSTTVFWEYVNRSTYGGRDPAEDIRLHYTDPLNTNRFIRMVGDLNDDCYLNFGDFTIFSGQYNSNCAAGGSYDWKADLNSDAFINFGDFTIFSGQYNKNCYQIDPIND
jgi:hypothetical protein